MCADPARIFRGWCVLSLLWVIGAGSVRAEQSAVPAQQVALQSDPNKFLCTGRHVQVALGLLAGDQPLFDRFQKDAPATSGAQVCGAIAWGNEYELLSWLENGGVQAAVLPAFVVDVMRADDPTKFERDYFRFPAQALTSVPPRVREINLEDGKGVPIAAAHERLQRFYADLRTQARPNASLPSATIQLPNHLSGAVKFLITDAASWASGQNLTGDARDAFFASLINSIHFSFSTPCGVDNAQPDALRIVEKVRPADQPDRALATLPEDTLLVRRQVLLSAPALVDLVSKARSPASSASPSIGLFAPMPQDEKQIGKAVTAFRDANYRLYQVGESSRRYFRFTLPELWSLLGNARDEPWKPGTARARSNVPDEKLALVLTGGGVKAAYQTRMVDYLYGRHCLFNAGMAGAPNSQQVDYVIGTSGGALLGSFVASMNQPVADALVSSLTTPRKGNGVASLQPQTLTEVVWKLPSPGIRSSDVFPLVDMLRYASIVVGFLILAFVGAFALAWFPDRFANVKRRPAGELSVRRRRARGLNEAWPWMLVLGLSPLVIIYVAGGSSVEQVPWIAGIFYLGIAAITVYSELCLTEIKTFSWRDVRMSHPALWMGAVGLALVLIAVRPWPSLRALPGFGPGAQGFVLVACVGFVLLTLALHSFFRSQSKYFRCENNGHLLNAVVVVLGLLCLAYIALSAVAALNTASFLELTGGFWKWFILFMLLLSCLLLWMGHTREPDEEKHSWLQKTVGFMFSEFRSRAVFGSERRYMRFARVAVIAWVWWNLLVAPGLYGNENAQGYFKAAFDQYILERSAGKKGSEFALTVPFVIAATSLEKQQERYFLFGSEDTLDRALAPQAWLHVASDPRWAVIRNVQVSELRDAAFASGSPFPVFSAHKVPVHALNTEERLIDGGFAHNIPLDAAAALGAQKVLVISSSPLETGAPSAPCRWASLLSVGDLTCNLPKLLPYLWERSQVEDLLSTRNMFVAVIYPTASENGWPSLTDFRATVVKDLVDAADRDQRDRIGVVESWGVPEVSRAQLFDYDLELVSAKLGDLAKAVEE